MNAEKEAIRRDMISRRSLISQSQAREAGRKVVDELLLFLKDRSFPEEQRGLTVFAPIRGEIDLLHDAYRFEQLGFFLCLPRIEQGEMQFFRYREQDALVISSFGIPEPQSDALEVTPSQIAVVICPGLAFDPGGSRLGYGKGYYDIYLSRYKGRHRPVLIGAAYPFQLLARLPQSETDIRMDYIFTPESNISCDTII